MGLKFIDFDFLLVACGRALWPARFATCSVRIVVTVNSTQTGIISNLFIQSRVLPVFEGPHCSDVPRVHVNSWKIVITRVRKIVQKREKWLRILTPPSAWMLCRSFGQTGFSLLSKENKFLPLIYIDKNITVFVSLRIDFFWRCGNSSSSLMYWPIHIQSNPIQASFYCISSSCFREPMNFVHMQSSSSAVIVGSI